MIANLIIDGEPQPAASGLTFDCFDPATGKLASATAEAAPVDAERAALAASKAFASWSRTRPTHRRALLWQAADRLLEAREEIVSAMVLETGAARSWAAFNCDLGANMLREAAAMTTQLTGETMPTDRSGSLSFATREPWGVCFGIAPWNAPIVLFVRSFAMALACGNTCVLKSSESCPATHYTIIERVCRDFPRGVVNLVSGSRAATPALVETLIRHEAIRHVNFTGSSKIGRVIGRLAGEALKPCVLELGGKSPLVVLDDANLDDAVQATAFSAFMHQGQICMASGRVIVDARIADEFVDRLAEKASGLAATRGGGNGQLGGMINASAVQRVQTLMEDAVGKGAIRRAGGTAEGVFLEPVVLDRVTPGMAIYHEEVFGPVAVVIRTGSDDEAVQVANDTEYGLSAAVFSKDINRAMAVARSINSGICHINGPTIQDEAHVPFGGIKASGIGRFGGAGGLEAFTYRRWMTIDTERPHYPF
ncbi:aldehyde dehydrogenase family protein [Acidisoma cladoniae]|jgi:acyl-CoA reductase-like NAD-dependent aldehyde dehydrogenase|uniref:aldehyde dehydrogenase family protein n=1 Tax=Acidisoma cladoniae TaxID=3040935 RepID=UPI00254BC852|nr:aldehyde dehydrogenase family protein [Acidisoma sp. PAMC 29798]